MKNCFSIISAIGLVLVTSQAFASQPCFGNLMTRYLAQRKQAEDAAYSAKKFDISTARNVRFSYNYENLGLKTTDTLVELEAEFSKNCSEAKQACSKEIADYVETGNPTGQVIANMNMTSVLFGYKSEEYLAAESEFNPAFANQEPKFLALEKCMGRDIGRFEPK